MSGFFSSTAGRRLVLYGLVVLVLALGTAGVLLLLENISQRKYEARQVFFRVVELNEDTEDPSVWGKNFPNQYDTYLRTVDTVRTKYGGSEAFQKLDAFPVWRELFRGYAFGIDYREDRGHAYMLSDQRQTERVTKKPQPGACVQCHLPSFPLTGKSGCRRVAYPMTMLIGRTQSWRGSNWSTLCLTLRQRNSSSTRLRA